MGNGSFEAMDRRKAATRGHCSGAEPVLSFLDRPGDAVGASLDIAKRVSAKTTDYVAKPIDVATLFAAPARAAPVD